MTDPIIREARERFIASHPRSAIIERAARNGAYDNGSWIQDQVRAVLRDRKEAEGE